MKMGPIRKSRHCRSGIRCGRAQLRRLLMCLLAALVPFFCASRDSMAYLIRTDQVTNSFVPAQITAKITQTLSGSTQKDVKIKNEGNLPAYVRAAVFVYWKLPDGCLLIDCGESGIGPQAGVDYTIQYGAGKWKQHPVIDNPQGSTPVTPFMDHYYEIPLGPGEETEPLVVTCTDSTAASDGRVLVVDVCAELIQEKAAEEAWQIGLDAQGHISRLPYSYQNSVPKP